ncbi:hypothetical protein ROZALSC1DRAFT_24784 [Rozella allomycis CSF55]|uniref:GATA-type domain-containing protein n=1 Tax=Rozella allomycis (strain CSF55) TaxID=988480 RepID=A0A4P9YF20_ROZAC|nr:hypothetical protein ROZALSC1DRAFT_24784 [Rozella allomycis CSF55]
MDKTTRVMPKQKATFDAENFVSRKRRKSNLNRSCANCAVNQTPLWRTYVGNDHKQHTICNRCGLYLKKHGILPQHHTSHPPEITQRVQISDTLLHLDIENIDLDLTDPKSIQVIRLLESRKNTSIDLSAFDDHDDSPKGTSQ